LTKETKILGSPRQGGVSFSNLCVVEALPLSRFSPEGGENLLRGMAGGTIIKIGSTTEEGIEGGGLIIDYRRAGSSVVERAVFAFNDSGLWVEWAGSVASASS